jgi:hypothetical protein
MYSQDFNSTKKLIDVTQKAYKAYEVRRLVIDEIMKTYPIQQQLAKYWIIHKNFKGIKLEPIDHGYEINQVTGVIKFDLAKASKAFNSGDYISMHPEIDNDYFNWQCQTNVTSNFVPMSCQE